MVSPVNLNQFGYESIREIGRGRFGSVLLVRSTSEIHHMSVCKIIMLESLCEGDKRLAEQEVNLLQSLIHRSIVRFEDVIRIAPGSSLGLVMEYCDGGDLRHAILEQATRGSYFPENEVMTWFTQILEGLRFIHANRIIHRDLKTSNIFLKGPPPYRCLIGDFGISKVLEETLSSAHTVIGTPYYISPEVCKREPYTVKFG
jgi:NIMA (never in mitosis gene a)-related kinase